MCRAGYICLIVAALAAVARADTTVDGSNRYAYAANLGWLNASSAWTGASIGESFCTGHVWGANVGWIDLGRGPTNGWAYGNTGTNDWGVNHDGEGRLTGTAYGANIGWIVFEQTQGQPRIDLRSGVMSGYAWSPNCGWIGFSNQHAWMQTARLDAGADSDGDGMPDAWERRWTGGLDRLSGNGHDADGDGVSDADEYAADTDPERADDRLEIRALTHFAGTNRLEWTARSTRLYRLETTNRIEFGSARWAESAAGLMGPATGETLTWTDGGGSGASSGFFRVRAVVPLSE